MRTANASFVNIVAVPTTLGGARNGRMVSAGRLFPERGRPYPSPFRLIAARHHMATNALSDSTIFPSDAALRVFPVRY